MRGLRAGASVCMALTVVCLAHSLAGPARAATVTTTADTDDGVCDVADCSLREAINTGDDTIEFDLDPDQTITLLSDLPALGGDVTIDATGAPNLTLDAAGFRVLLLDAENATVVDLETETGSFEIGASDTLTFTANNDFEVSSDISNTVATMGSLVKDGDATLTLSGASTFDGSLTIEAGALAFEVDDGDDVAFAASISGDGAFEKSGDGKLTLDGVNTYVGGTTISGGTLAGTVTSIQGDVVNNDALMIDGAGDFDGDISGTGSFTKSGAGELKLNGTNTYEGGTTVEDGTLIGDTAAIQGAVELTVTTATLEFAESGSGTHSGTISGLGAVVKSDTGSVRLTGVNSYEGGTTVEAGTLIVDTDSLPAMGGTLIEDLATLVFDQQSSGEFGGVISGDGGLEKQGGGVLLFDTAHSYLGGTLVTGGTLELGDMGSLASDVIVAPAGTLAGTGNVSGSTTVSGSVSPGSAGAGILGLGDVEFESGSRLEIDVSDDGMNDDRLTASAVTGADLASLVVDVAPGDYSSGVTIDVIVASTITGAFSDPADSPFLTIDVSQAGGTLQISVLGDVYGNVEEAGETQNQKAVGEALDTFMEGDDPDIDELFEHLGSLATDPEVNAALDALTGESISAFTTARLAMGERLQRTLHRRMRSVLFASDRAWPAVNPGSRPRSRPRRSSGPTDVAAPPTLGERGIGSWFDGYGVLGELDGDDNAGDVDYAIYGASAGLDVRLGDRVLAGVSAGYARTDVELDDREGDGDADTAQGALYAAYASPLFYAGVSGRYAWSSSESTREIDIDTLSLRARGDFDSHDYGARGELAINAFETPVVRLQPLAAFEWSHLTREGFTESGAGSLGLDVDSEQLDTALLQLGARVEWLFLLPEGAVFAPELRAFWLHEFGDRERQLEAAIGGAPFSVNGAEAPRDGGLIGVGWSVSLSNNLRASLDYDARIDSDRLEHTGNISIRLRF